MKDEKKKKETEDTILTISEEDIMPKAGVCISDKLKKQEIKPVPYRHFTKH